MADINDSERDNQIPNLDGGEPPGDDSPIPSPDEGDLFGDNLIPNLDREELFGDNQIPNIDEEDLFNLIPDLDEGEPSRDDNPIPSPGEGDLFGDNLIPNLDRGELFGDDNPIPDPDEEDLFNLIPDVDEGDPLRDNQIPDVDEGGEFGNNRIRTPVEEDPFGYEGRLPKPLLAYLKRWHYWYNLIVHCGADVAPRPHPHFLFYYLTTKTKPAPFPLNLDETWYCGALVLLIVAVHDSVIRGWLFEEAYPYPRWAGRVLGRVLLTLGAAVLSTLSFEVAGRFLGDILRYVIIRVTFYVDDGISAFLIRNLHWGRVDEDGEPMRDQDADFIWFQDPSKWREAIRWVFQELTFVFLEYFASFSVGVGVLIAQSLVEWVAAPALNFLFSIPVSFIPALLTWLSLPTPGSDGIHDPRTLWLEYGMPIVIQFWVLLLLWLLQILYMAKAERLAMEGWRLIDPKMNVVWHLIRATAMHMIAYTAYQLVQGIVVGIKSELPQGSRYLAIIDGSIVPFLGRLIPEGRIFAAALLFFFHWLIRAASMHGIRLARPFWVPYILWQTRYSEQGARMYWPMFLEAIESDFSVLNPEKRVTSRVAMTALFGLRSSWPARFHLSNVVADD